MARIRSMFWGGVTMGTDQSDEITGSSVADVIFAGRGNDVINAGAGNDVIMGDAGADTINGGTGIDTVNYSDAARSTNPFSNLSGVYVDLAQGIGANSDAQGDTYNSIENVTGSQFDDYIIGNSSNNVMNGLGGNDEFWGDLGADTYNGGSGTDEVDYGWVDSNVGVTVNLQNGTGTGGLAQGDTLISIENVSGTSNRDIIVGSSADNVLIGNGGDDVLDGGAGRDTLLGGFGNDTLFGGSGNDRILGGPGDDTMWGDQGADTFVIDLDSRGFGDGNDRIMDFQSNDTIEFRYNFQNYDISELNFRQVGEDTVITFDHQQGSVTLVGVDATELRVSDFDFV